MSQNEIKKTKRGKLKIFFGYAPGVGKTYSMIKEAERIKKLGKDVVIGFVNSHGREEISSISKNIEKIENNTLDYGWTKVQEFNLDGSISRRPYIILVDELEHLNFGEQRHRKRWQDIQDLLDKGVNVYTTLNVQNIESLNDAISNLTGIDISETVPDRIFEGADKVEIVDIEPDELLKRFESEDIYVNETIRSGILKTFTREKLYALREIALRKTADRLSYKMESSRLLKDSINVMPTSNKILACISSSPSSSKVIRSAARMAEAYHSKWIMLYVKTARFSKMKNKDRARLNSYFSLAKQLGGEIAVVWGNDIAESILKYAKFRNATKVVMGKNNKNASKFFYFYAKDVVDKIMNSSSYIDLYVVTDSIHRKRKTFIKTASNFKLKFSINDAIKAVLIMVSTICAAKIFEYMDLSEVNIFMILILGIILTYIKTTGYFVGVISSLIGVCVFNYLFIQPRGSFQFYDKNYITTFAMVLIAASVIGGLTNRLQEEAKNSFIREKRTHSLYTISGKLLSSVGNSEVVAVGVKYISRLIDRTVVCYIPKGGKLSSTYVYNCDMESDKDIFSRENEKKAAEWSFSFGRESGNSTDTFYNNSGYYIPIKAKDTVMGVIGISCLPGTVDHEKKFIAKSIVSQVALAMDRENLVQKQENSKIQIEKERFRSNLLRSISHDIRSPLAGIKGSVSTILEKGDFIDKETKVKLLSGVYDDTEWLVRLVENLLSMTKFDERGTIKINKNMEVVEEVLSEAVQRSSRIFKDHKIEVKVPETVIMLPMDGGLIEQVIINLIDNAAKFSKEGSVIYIKAFLENKNAVFEVIDSGKGIDEKILPHIFDTFFTDGSEVPDSRRGVGLGLAICKSIVHAHGGKIMAFNRKDGGSVFKFSIPVREMD